MSNLNLETVTSVHHWTDTLFSFTHHARPAASASRTATSR